MLIYDVITTDSKGSKHTRKIICGYDTAPRKGDEQWLKRGDIYADMCADLIKNMLVVNLVNKDVVEVKTDIESITVSKEGTIGYAGNDRWTKVIFDVLSAATVEIGLG